MVRTSENLVSAELHSHVLITVITVFHADKFYSTSSMTFYFQTLETVELSLIA